MGAGAAGLLASYRSAGAAQLAFLTLFLAGSATVFWLPGVRLALYRVAQEALANIRKHARPHKVEVCLAYQARTVRLTVRDFGAPAAAPAAGPGSGLASTADSAAGPSTADAAGAGAAGAASDAKTPADPAGLGPGWAAIAAGQAGRCRAGTAAGPGSAGPAEPAGYGLIGMRERAELLGGTLTAAPAGDGFLVEMEVPA